MKTNAISTKIHIPTWDCQGSLTPPEKQHIAYISTFLLRQLNPDAYIVLTGHGIRPQNCTLDLCDAVFWENKVRPLDERGCVIGMPAQFYFVYQGLDHLRDRGFDYALKTRGDCILSRPDICKWSKDIIDSEQKFLLVTQMTSRSDCKLGDCFMYGETEDLKNIWHKNNEVQCEEDGVRNTGLNFRKYFVDRTSNYETDWSKLCKTFFSFRNVNTIPLIDLRWNYRNVIDRFGPNGTIESVLNGTFPVDDYYWGKTNGWFRFEGKKAVVNFDGTCWDEESFYENK